MAYYGPDWRRGLYNSRLRHMSMPDQYRYAQDYNTMQTEGRANYIRQGYTDMLAGSGRAFAGRSAEINEQGAHNLGQIQQGAIDSGLTGSTAGLAAKGTAQRETAFAQNQLTRQQAEHQANINMRRLQFEEDISNRPPNLENMARLAELEGRYNQGPSFAGPPVWQHVTPTMWSDVRLKTDIEHTGTSPDGVNIYSFKYKGDDTTYQGVMAQEVPWASIEGDGGYYMVDYSKVDVDFKRLA